MNFLLGLPRETFLRFSQQGFRPTILWIADHATRIATGAPIRRLSQISSNLHVGGQYRPCGWPILKARGITGVVNMRDELEADDSDTGILPSNYLRLPTIDDEAPMLEHLYSGVAFIAEEISRGGSVYIHCRSGVGRSATMAAAYLVSSGLNPDEAWASIQKIRPFIRPTAPQIAQLNAFAGELTASR
mgnify:CR=1 FL=1